MSDFKIAPFPRKPKLRPATVVAITDGACSGNPGPGGWGVVLRRGEDVHELHGGDSETTNNRMEITAVIETLKALEQPCEVEIVSDSQYLINTMTQGWKRKQNLDLWQALDAAIAPGTIIIWTWVRGHNGHTDNERADALARMGIEQARNRST